jgi:hypothetical protein
MSEALADVYTTAVHHNLKQYATWPIGSLLQVGDYGTLQGTMFNRIGNIADARFKIKCKEAQSPARLVFEFKSAEIEETKLRAGASANVTGTPATVNAKATLNFAKSNSVYFRSTRLSYMRLDNFADVSQAIMDAFKKGAWDGNLVFIQDLFISKGTTVIISISDGATIDIEATAKGIEQIDLADVNAGLSFTHDRNVGLKVIGE